MVGRVCGQPPGRSGLQGGRASIKLVAGVSPVTTRKIDMKPIEDFMHHHGLGVDDLFFALHLGAERVAHNAAHPPSTREHWRRIAFECRQLWQDYSAEGERLNPERPAGNP